MSHIFKISFLFTVVIILTGCKSTASQKLTTLNTDEYFIGKANQFVTQSTLPNAALFVFFNVNENEIEISDIQYKVNKLSLKKMYKYNQYDDNTFNECIEILRNNQYRPCYNIKFADGSTSGVGASIFLKRETSLGNIIAGGLTLPVGLIIGKFDPVDDFTHRVSDLNAIYHIGRYIDSKLGERLVKNNQAIQKYQSKYFKSYGLNHVSIEPFLYNRMIKESAAKASTVSELIELSHMTHKLPNSKSIDCFISSYYKKLSLIDEAANIASIQAANQWLSEYKQPIKNCYEIKFNQTYAFKDKNRKKSKSWKFNKGRLLNGEPQSNWIKTQYGWVSIKNVAKYNPMLLPLLKGKVEAMKVAMYRENVLKQNSLKALKEHIKNYPKESKNPKVLAQMTTLVEIKRKREQERVRKERRIQAALEQLRQAVVKAKKERRKKNFSKCVQQMIGTEGCATLAKKAGKDLNSDLYDIATGPSCTVLINESLNIKYSNQDMYSSTTIEILDKLAIAGIESDSLLSNLGGIIMGVMSYAERRNNFEKCLNQ